MAVFICLAATSCDNEYGVAPQGNPGTPAADTKGVYTGEWTRTLDGNTTTAVGTITFTPGEGNHVTYVDLSCPELQVDYHTVANIAKGNDGDYVFANQEANKNGLGSAFSGRIKDDNVTIKFTLSIKEGRKQYLYDYAFSGDK